MENAMLDVFLTRLFAAKCSAFATLAVLIWDHLITLDQEISRIWCQPWTGATLLFFLNRYIPPSQSVLQIMSMMYPPWHGHTCDHLFRLPGGSSLFATAMAELILILRTYALYGQHKGILAVLLSLFLGHVTVMCVAVAATARPVPLPHGIPGCMMTGSGPSFVLFWTTPWIADTIIFSLTIFKTMQYRRRHARTRLLHILERDGALFYLVIFAINSVNIAIYLFTPPGVKPIGAPFCQSLTTTMISRLQLNLRAPCVHAPARARPPPGLDRPPSALVTASSMSAGARLSTVILAPQHYTGDTTSHSGSRYATTVDTSGKSAPGMSLTDICFGEHAPLQFAPRAADSEDRVAEDDDDDDDDAAARGEDLLTRTWMQRMCDTLGAPLGDQSASGSRSGSVSGSGSVSCSGSCSGSGSGSGCGAGSGPCSSCSAEESAQDSYEMHGGVARHGTIWVGPLMRDTDAGPVRVRIPP